MSDAMWFEVTGSSSARHGDYSLKSALFASVNLKSDVVTVEVFPDLAKRYEAPSPKFTTSGGESPKVFAALRALWKEGEKRCDVDGRCLTLHGDHADSAQGASDKQNRLRLFRSDDGDFTLETSDASGEIDSKPVSFTKASTYHKFIHNLLHAIEEDNRNSPYIRENSRNAIRFCSARREARDTQKGSC